MNIRFAFAQVLSVVLMVSGVCGAPAMAADDVQTRVLGNWLTEPKDGIIQISQAADGTLQGRIVGGNEPGKLELSADGSVKVRGFIGVSLLGKNQVWTRYTGTSMDLPKAAQ